MREVRGDDRVAADRAETGDVGAPVDLASARAHDASLTEQLVGLGGSALELCARQCGHQHVRCSAAAVRRGSSCP
jgi:hypothetical protein